jgi:hypothetical protein
MRVAAPQQYRQDSRSSSRQTSPNAEGRSGCFFDIDYADYLAKLHTRSTRDCDLAI